MPHNGAEPASAALNLRELLRLFSGDWTDDLWWSCTGEGNLRFFVTCNDFFAWGGGDAEEIRLDTADDLRALREARVDAPEDWPLLWVARKRGMRPQGACYRHLEEQAWPLFDACGPHRAVGLGNPVAHPTDSDQEDR